MKIVLQKFIAQAGFCSRRQAEEFIKKGRVFINGKIAEPGVRADENDEVEIGGKMLVLHKKLIYIKLNKPQGYVCTSRKFKDEKNVFDLVEVDERLFAVGRLDKDSRGLVLLTNDGDLAQRLTHPKYGHKKNYEVRIKNCELSNEKIKEIENKFIKGVDIGEGDGVVKAKKISYVGDEKFAITLTEGKKRQIRRMFAALGYQVVDLIRVGIGNLELWDLKEGEWKYLSDEEIKYITTAETPCGG